MYIESAKSLTRAAEGKVVFTFLKAGEDLGDLVTSSFEAQANGIIVAGIRSDIISISHGSPLLMVDYGQGTTMLKYLDSTRY